MEERFHKAKNHTFADLEHQDANKKEFKFVQMADTQFGMLTFLKKIAPFRVLNTITFGLANLPIPKDAQPSMSKEEAYAREVEMATEAVRRVNLMQPRPEFVVVCGDLVNAYPWQGDLQRSQVQDFKRVMSEIHSDIHLVCVCGNHDIGDRPNAHNVALYRERFGDDFFVFWVGDVRFLVLNSQFYKDASNCAELLREHNQWLDELESTQTNPPPRTIVFSHIAPFLFAANEPEGYFNLTPQTRMELLARMQRLGVVSWFCGHYHRNAGGVWNGGADLKRPIEVVVTAAVGTNITTDQRDPLGLQGMESVVIDNQHSGFREVVVTPSQVVHKWVSFADGQA